MFNLFISLYQDKVKNAGIRKASCREKIIFGAIIATGLIECISVLLNCILVTALAVFVLLYLLYSLQKHEKSLSNTYNINKLINQKRKRIRSLKSIVQKCSLWNEQGLLWLEEKCEEEICRAHSINTNFDISGKFSAFVTIATQLINEDYGNFLFEFFLNNKFYIVLIFVVLFFISIAARVKAFFGVDYAQIKEELSYLRITTFN